MLFVSKRDGDFFHGKPEWKTHKKPLGELVNMPKFNGKWESRLTFQSPRITIYVRKREYAYMTFALDKESPYFRRKNTWQRNC